MDLNQLIERHQKEKKQFEIRDAYKLIYQSILGVAHILDDREKAKNYLQREIADIDSIDSEPLIENISISGDVVRLNLRPYKFHYGDVDSLFAAMLRSAETIQGTKADFLKQWKKFKQAVEKGKLKFDVQQLHEFDEEVKRADFPAVHHSQAYREANQPAYRVLTGEQAEQLLKKQQIRKD